jgi:predicted GIY-YIG superfamily endonuclease
MLNDRDTTRTYILLCNNREYYCGKAINLENRLKEHTQAKNGSWFKIKNRTNFILLFDCIGDFEREIKRFGISKFVACLTAILVRQKEVSLS